jgi:hypothetical protein
MVVIMKKFPVITLFGQKLPENILHRIGSYCQDSEPVLMSREKVRQQIKLVKTRVTLTGTEIQVYISAFVIG